MILVQNLLMHIMSFFRFNASGAERTNTAPVAEVRQELQVAFSDPGYSVPFFKMEHKELGDDECRHLTGKKVAWIETGEVSVCLHFDDDTSLTVSIPR